MHSATARAGRLANQLLALAKAESAPDQGRPLEVIDLMAVGYAAARDWFSKAIAHRIDLGFALAPALIEGDPLFIPELVDNLIDNALRYTPAGGAATVSTGVRDGAPYLSVEGTGPGITASERAEVVERFYRIPGTNGDGSGLGLAIVKEIVDRHSGMLEIEAREGSSGTRVRVCFPVPGPLAPEKQPRRMTGLPDDCAQDIRSEWPTTQPRRSGRRFPFPCAHVKSTDTMKYAGWSNRSYSQTTEARSDEAAN